MAPAGEARRSASFSEGNTDRATLATIMLTVIRTRESNDDGKLVITCPRVIRTYLRTL